MLKSIETLHTHLIKSKFKSYTLSSFIHYGELTILLPVENLENAIKFLRDDKKCQFKMLLSISGVDYPNRTNRFEIVYHLLSLVHNTRIRIKVNVKDTEIVPSITNIFGSAGWYEREVWDMFGIYFAKHPDLRRILTDYEFEGHPLRKDFPLTGYTEVRYDLASGKVVYEPVTLTQDFRNFDFLSPWNEISNISPGDEKVTKD